MEKSLTVEVSYREIRSSFPAWNCLLQGEGSFTFIPDIVAARIGRIVHELQARERECVAALTAIKTKYERMRTRVKAPSKEGEEAQTLKWMEVPVEDKTSFDSAVQEVLDTKIELILPKIKATQLRRAPNQEEREQGKTSPFIPGGWYYFREEGNEEKQKDFLGTAALLYGISPFIEMDLETVESDEQV